MEALPASGFGIFEPPIWLHLRVLIGSVMLPALVDQYREGRSRRLNEPDCYVVGQSPLLLLLRGFDNDSVTNKSLSLLHIQKSYTSLSKFVISSADRERT